MRKLLSLRKNEILNFYFSLFVFLSAAISVLIQLISAIFVDDDGLLRLVYFTIQSNILMSVIIGLYILKKPSEKWFSRLAFIGLVNISVTGIVFHVMLTPYMSSVGLMQHMLHTINPILYVMFYFIFIKEFVRFKETFIVLIYPLLYMIFVFGFVAPVLGNKMELVSGSLNSSRYVYPFLNPENYQNGFFGLLLFNLGILAPSILLFSILLQYLKRKFETSLNEKETS
jgi:hypothetical protein